MLSRLEIHDFALIDSLVIDFKSGLTILTGETGAGKSIIIDSIGAITGNRVNKDMIRHGRDCSVITAVFEDENLSLFEKIFAEQGIPTDDPEIIITREIYQNGKTFARLNGKIIPMSSLKEITRNLLDIHGQHENQSIFRQDMQLDLLDRFAGEPVMSAISLYQAVLDPYNACMRSLQDFVVDEASKNQLIDILEFQIKEIKTIHPKLNEDDELTERRRLIANVEKIRTALEESYFYLAGESALPALAALKSAKNLIDHQLGNFDEYNPIKSSLADIEFALEDVCDQIRDKMEKVVVLPGELEKIDERLDQLFKLKKKYGGNIENVLEFYKKSSQKLNEILTSEDRINELQKQKEELLKQLKEKSADIYEKRIQAALSLEKKICAELNALGMKETRFKVDINHQFDAGQFGRNGCDQIEFMISPNVGEDLKPLSRIASGGEASRIMLAIKTILAESDRIPLLIFDEIDTGISGKTAILLGEKLLAISSGHQVLCVTHMAQIAAKAAQHINIEKVVANNETTTKIRILSDEDRIIEIARLLSGGENEKKALELASEMLAVNKRNN
ncbi:MAG: DNA repair protein RecN [Saccharofermentanales bacterium]